MIHACIYPLRCPLCCVWLRFWRCLPFIYRARLCIGLNDNQQELTPVPPSRRASLFVRMGDFEFEPPRHRASLDAPSSAGNFQYVAQVGSRRSDNEAADMSRIPTPFTQFRSKSHERFNFSDGLPETEFNTDALRASPLPPRSHRESPAPPTKTRTRRATADIHLQPLDCPSPLPVVQEVDPVQQRLSETGTPSKMLLPPLSAASRARALSISSDNGAFVSRYLALALMSLCSYSCVDDA